MTTCGGCEGLGAHVRWCPRDVGPKASLLGRHADAAERLADSIGSNNVRAANHAYAAAGLLLAAAHEAAMEWQRS